MFVISWSDQLERKVYHINMKVLPVANCLLIAAASLIQTAVGLNCNSLCAACWKDDSPGIDIKIGCAISNGYCGDKCPQGYYDLHCAKTSRCE
jgi:hypothetical protein